MITVTVLMPEDRQALQDRLTLLVVEQVKQMLSPEELKLYADTIRSRNSSNN